MNPTVYVYTVHQYMEQVVSPIVYVYILVEQVVRYNGSIHQLLYVPCTLYINSTLVSHGLGCVCNYGHVHCTSILVNQHLSHMD